MKTMRELIKEATLRLAEESHGSGLAEKGNCAENALITQKMLESGYQPYFPQVFESLVAAQADTSKGILLTGRAGTGKTHFFKSLYNNKYIKTASEIVRIYQENHCRLNGCFWFDLLRAYEGESWTRELVIDDLGQEPGLNNYGIKIEVLEEVICRRYQDWQRAGANTYFTTNLTAQELDSRYSRRVTDRIAEMCHIVRFDGQSLRTPRGKATALSSQNSGTGGQG